MIWYLWFKVQTYIAAAPRATKQLFPSTSGVCPRLAMIGNLHQLSVTNCSKFSDFDCSFGIIVAASSLPANGLSHRAPRARTADSLGSWLLSSWYFERSCPRLTRFKENNLAVDDPYPYNFIQSALSPEPACSQRACPLTRAVNFAMGMQTTGGTHFSSTSFKRGMSVGCIDWSGSSTAVGAENSHSLAYSPTHPSTAMWLCDDMSETFAVHEQAFLNKNLATWKIWLNSSWQRMRR